VSGFRERDKFCREKLRREARGKLPGRAFRANSFSLSRESMDQSGIGGRIGRRIV